MYSGTTLTRLSGRIMGAHQKFDSVSRRHLKLLGVNKTAFPGIREILAFEGRNGPDAIKRKSPAVDEPWHFFNPMDTADRKLVDLIEQHFKDLVECLQSNNRERASFEAAWLAHSIVDGLTPAHHFPYEESLVNLRGGKSIESRTTVKEKLLLPGDTLAERIGNNWKMWGAKGLITTHSLFELGVATLIKPLTFSTYVPDKSLIDKAKKLGLGEFFVSQAQVIYKLDLYTAFYQKGWTPRLAWQIRHKLAPMISQTVTIAWYLAAEAAEE